MNIACDPTFFPQKNTCPLWGSFKIQCRIIWALILREIITRFGRHNIGFAWMFAEPMMFTVGITILWNLFGGHRHASISITAFALTGYSCVLLWRNMPGLAETAVKMNLPLLYHRNVRVLDFFLARLLLQAAGATMSFIILGIFFTWIGLIHPPEDILKVFLGWMMNIFFGISLAIYIGALATQHHIVEKIWHPFSYITFSFSGAGFLVESLPPSAQKFVSWVPMVHGSECVRDGFFGSQFKAHYSISYVVITSLILLFLGLLEVKKATRFLEH
ncbi:MAG: ABC transporter permease [Chthoniobacterales bacterium]